jgi:[ribosomal protein S18]-alanine N-acetyltransferase
MTSVLTKTRNLKLDSRNPKVRLATAADIPAMMELEKHAATAGHWSGEHYEEIFAAADSPGSRRPVVLLIEEEGTVLGFLVARSVGSEWEIENIAIDGPARRRGLGTRLVGEFIDQARTRGATAVFLEVRESNQPARSLYEKWAFVESGRRKRYYRNPEEDAVLYRFEFP